MTKLIYKSAEEQQLDHWPKHIRIGTLGPSGTSSEYVAKHVIHTILKHKKCELFLFDSFENSIGNLLLDQLDAVIVPHAYSNINHFYMDPRLYVGHIFRADTPLYGLAVRKDFIFHEEMLDYETVVSHPAPVTLVKHYMNRDVNFKLVESTSEAARHVRDKELNIAVTNEEAVQEYNLRFVREFKRIPMSWTIFVKDESLDIEHRKQRIEAEVL